MAKSKMVKVDEVKIESLIKRNFTEKFLKSIYNIYSDDCMSIVEKTIKFDKLFTDEFGARKDYRRIGEGTNRFVCLLDNHIIKVAYNYLAYIDNMNELAMAKKLPNQLAKAYETNGIILVSEYVTVMDKEDFLESQTAVQLILSKLESRMNINNKEKSLYYILGDMGMSNKNYGNWGRRTNGEIVVLDYGYLYEVSYSNWREISKCPTCGSSLAYTPDYSELSCDKETCNCKVKYTTLRNNLGYAEIIDNINQNINNDKYVKFNKDGNIVVDIMEKVEEKEEDYEKFEMPAEYQAKFDRTMSEFFDLATLVKKRGQFTFNFIIDKEKELYSEIDEYDEVLFPYLLTVINTTDKNIESYLNDFNKNYTARYNEIYTLLESENDINVVESLDDLYPDCDYSEDNEGYEVNDGHANASDIAFVDRLAREDEKRVVTSLDSMLSAELGGDFGSVFMADENSEIMDKLDDSNEAYSLDEIMAAISNEMIDSNEEEDDSDDDDTEMIDNMLETRFGRLKDALTELLTNVIVNEDGFVEGDIYRTYLNGDYIDFDYSPEVNASNILGGWRPSEFAFPLYRHMLAMFDYDTELVDEEYEARYRIGESIQFPEDIYNKVENRNIVIDQILNRFENDKPSKAIIINSIGIELNRYYEALDMYYEDKRVEQQTVGYDDPSYYFELTKTNTDISKEIQEAKENLEDELIDQQLSLKDELRTQKLVYYYDTEYLYNNTQLDILDIIKEMRCLTRNGVVKENLKDAILNKYFATYRTVVTDNVLDPFKYDGSLVVESGSELHPRLRKPILKAKLVPMESNQDIYKPQIFSREVYTRVIVEQRFETIFRDTPEDTTKLNDLILDLNKRGLYYYQSKQSRYVVRGSKDNLRYLLTEHEVELLNEYQELYGITDIKDIDKLYAKSIIDTMVYKQDICNESLTFLRNVAKLGLSGALAERSFIINVLESSGAMTRLDYLSKIK